MSIVQVLCHPDELRPNPWNSNVVPPENEAKLEEAIRRHGFVRPIIGRRVAGMPGIEIVGGQHRWGAARRLGLTEVPVVDLGLITDSRAKEIGLLDNARYGSDEVSALAALISSLDQPDDITSYLPYSDDSIKDLFSSSSIDLDNLDIDERFDADEAKDASESIAAAPKTHLIMRFAVPIIDGEKITHLIDAVQKRHGYTTSNALTNAGDALVHLLKGQTGA